MSDATQSYRQDFIELALECEVLQFGEFELKSGRVSPYFFNAGKISSGAALARLGRCYAAALSYSKLSPDMLFGPAYKGIPLVASTATALFSDHDIDLPFAFNRKEAKTHGEGGNIVGAKLEGDVVARSERLLELEHELVESELTAVNAVERSAELHTVRKGESKADVIFGLVPAEGARVAAQGRQGAQDPRVHARHADAQVRAAARGAVRGCGRGPHGEARLRGHQVLGPLDGRGGRREPRRGRVQGRAARGVHGPRRGAGEDGGRAALQPHDRGLAGAQEAGDAHDHHQHCAAAPGAAFAAGAAVGDGAYHAQRL